MFVFVKKQQLKGALAASDDARVGALVARGAAKDGGGAGL